MKKSLSVTIAVAALTLTSCGGGGGGGGVNSTPPPPASPPTSNPPPASGSLSDTSRSRSFATLGAYGDYDRILPSSQVNSAITLDSGTAIQVRYSVADQAYLIALPGLPEAKIEGGVSTQGLHRLQFGSAPGAPADKVEIVLGSPFADSPIYTYSQSGSWRRGAAQGTSEALRNGVFVFGAATAAGGVPIVGNATYTGAIAGVVNRAFVRSSENVITPFEIGGSVSMAVNFGNGTLSGQMKPELICGNCFGTDLGPLNFSGSLTGLASNSFSGSFVTAQAGPNAFSGFFTGPAAQEAIANFTVPFLDPYDFVLLQMSGIWIMKKPL